MNQCGFHNTTDKSLDKEREREDFRAFKAFFVLSSLGVLYVNLVLEYVPEMVYQLAKHYSRANQ